MLWRACQDEARRNDPRLCDAFMVLEHEDEMGLAAWNDARPLGLAVLRQRW